MHEAVTAVLDRIGDQPRTEFFFSGFLPVANYDVAVVLQLRYPPDYIRYSLPKVHADERYGAPSSFLDAVGEEFLRDCRKALYVPHAECVADLRERSAEELLRAAGDRLMHTPVWAAHNIDGLYGLFDSCNVISSLTYERAESLGGMLIARKGHSNIELTLSLKDPVPLKSYRRVRKLLQMAGHHQLLICDGGSVLGFGRMRGHYDQGGADLFELRFTGHYRWELYHGGHGMMRARYGTPELPLSALNQSKLGSDLQRLFPEANPEEVVRLVALAMEACEQRKGALLIISTDAESEAKRLSRQSTPIVPVLLTPELIRHLTAIDGAILLDPHGVCYAVGVILDGSAVEYGDPGRGARYNSSLRYLAERNNCAAVIVSEDRTAEWIPDLMPQIKRSDLIKAQGEVESLLAAPFNHDATWRALEWLRKHRFYLPEALCKLANELVSRERVERQKSGALIVIHEPFEPDSAMSDAYLID